MKHPNLILTHRYKQTMKQTMKHPNLLPTEKAKYRNPRPMKTQNKDEKH